MMTNYERLFSTPERVAVTFATIDQWQEKAIRMSPPPEPSQNSWYAPGMCYLLGEAIGVNFGENPLALFDWLNEEVER